MLRRDTIERALDALGALLEERGRSCDLVLCGGGALMLLDVIERPTEDLDAIGRMVDGEVVPAHPLSEEVVAAIDEVGRAYDLEIGGHHAWLNTGPSFLMSVGLPTGYRDRWTVRQYGALTVRLLSVFDQVHLKLLGVTAADRVSKRRDDLQDLRALAPDAPTLRAAVQWCAARDGRPDFVDKDIRPVLEELDMAWVLDDE